MTHNTKSGVAHFAADDEEQCLEDVRYLIELSAAQQPRRAAAEGSSPTTNPDRPRNPELDSLVPDDPQKPYDMRDVVARIVDDGEFFEVQEHFAQNIIVGFSRLDGHPIGVVGNQPNHLAGVLDINSSEKAARFVRFCDAFNVPLLTFTDVPGFLPGTSQEWGGIIRHGAKLLYAFTEATVPKLTVVTRKAYGGAYDVMNSKHMLADFNFAWPTAEVAVMGPEGAVNIIYRRDLAKSPTPDERRSKLIDDYKAHFANPYSAAERGYIDDVIEPRQTRPKLIRALRTLQTKRVEGPRRKHGNIPLDVGRNGKQSPPRPQIEIRSGAASPEGGPPRSPRPSSASCGKPPLLRRPHRGAAGWEGGLTRGSLGPRAAGRRLGRGHWSAIDGLALHLRFQ